MFNITPWKESSQLTVRDAPSLSSLQKEMNRLFLDFFGDDNRLSLFSPEESDGLLVAPAIDITEDDASYKVNAELPGLKREDIDIDISNNQLTIKGKKQTSSENTDENFIRRERRFGSFQRTMVLPETADLEKVDATFSNGVLKVELPKKEGTTTSLKIDIKDDESDTTTS